MLFCKTDWSLLIRNRFSQIADKAFGSSDSRIILSAMSTDIPSISLRNVRKTKHASLRRGYSVAKKRKWWCHTRDQDDACHGCHLKRKKLYTLSKIVPLTWQRVQPRLTTLMSCFRFHKLCKDQPPQVPHISTRIHVSQRPKQQWRRLKGFRWSGVWCVPFAIRGRCQVPSRTLSGKVLQRNVLWTLLVGSKKVETW